MTFSFPDNFLELAERLSKENDEAALRTSVSRAYYAAFHAAQTHCKKRNLLSGQRTAHRDVWVNFDPFAPGARREFRRLSSLSKQLQDARNSSDYIEQSPHRVDWSKESEARVKQSRQLLELIRGLDE